jgi:hypothetical protein
MSAHYKTTEVRESRNKADRPVSAHSKVANIVEEDHTCDARIVIRRAQQSAYHSV